MWYNRGGGPCGRPGHGPGYRGFGIRQIAQLFQFLGIKFVEVAQKLKYAPFANVKGAVK